MVKITVVVVGRNSPVLKQALQSVAFQDYPNYDVVLLDDNSGKQSENIALAKRVLGRRFSMAVTSDSRIGKVALYRKMLPLIDPRRFVVNVDADDYLVRRDALSIIASHVKGGAWVVFGRHRDLRGQNATPPDSKEHIHRLLGGRRTVGLWFDHPHCAYARILAEIPEESSILNGRHLCSCTDRFLFQQAMELSGEDRVVCTNKVLYEWRFPVVRDTSEWDKSPIPHESANTFEWRPKLERLRSDFVEEAERNT